jgi:hypothetical protein
LSSLDLSFVGEGRRLEVEALEGGRTSNEFTFAPAEIEDSEDQDILGTPMDDAIETEERLNLIGNYLEHARTAFSQRGLVYPFQASADGCSLEALPGLENLARRVGHLSSILGFGGSSAQEFEKSSFSALHKLVGGWGACVGSPRYDRTGPKRAIHKFRDAMRPWEKGGFTRDRYSKNGDYGADGFLVLGRLWGGPIVYFQAKNSSFELEDYANELARIPEIMNDWFGGYLNQRRRIIPVCALNTIMTIELKERNFQARGEAAGFHILDAVDMLASDLCDPEHDLMKSSCTIF